MTVAACSGSMRSASGDSTGAGSGGAPSGSGASTSGTGAPGTGGAGTGASSTVGSGTVGSGTGGSGTGGASAGACSDATDQGIIAQQHGDLLLEEAACHGAVGCLETALGLSEACATCYANAWLCLMNACAAACYGGPQAPGCPTCFATSCAPAQAACTGTVPSG
jgi:hypothetical protein